MKRVLKDARYFINRILFQNRSNDEWILLKKEVDDWWKIAPADQKEKYLISGAGECLAMICDCIE